MKRPKVGELRTRVTLQKPVDTEDAGAGIAVAWVDVETVWAKVVPLRGSELTHAMALANPVTHRVYIRHRTDVVGKWRLMLGTREMSIQAIVDEEERQKFLTLSCEEGLPT
jgi:SPP1 family predicted phage head-tail adaptor